MAAKQETASSNRVCERRAGKAWRPGAWTAASENRGDQHAAGLAFGSERSRNYWSAISGGARSGRERRNPEEIEEQRAELDQLTARVVRKAATCRNAETFGDDKILSCAAPRSCSKTSTPRATSAACARCSTISSGKNDLISLLERRAAAKECGFHRVGNKRSRFRIFAWRRPMPTPRQVVGVIGSDRADEVNYARIVRSSTTPRAWSATFA